LLASGKVKEVPAPRQKRMVWRKGHVHAPEGKQKHTNMAWGQVGKKIGGKKGALRRITSGEPGKKKKKK